MYEMSRMEGMLQVVEGGYRQQSAFELEEDKKLSVLVLPPGLDSTVSVSRRKHNADSVPAV